MKILHRFALRLLATSLLFFLGTALIFAGPQDERAGYQGIPVRNDLNRGLIPNESKPHAQRYPRLPRRATKADLGAAFVDGGQSSSQGHLDGGGYAGIPSLRSSAVQGKHDESVMAEVVQRPGYGGIPKRAEEVHQQAKSTSTLATRRGSGFAMPK